MPRHIPRLYLEQEFVEDGTCSLTAEQLHHLHRVLRLNSGANVLVFNGQQGEWLAELIIEGKKQGHLLLREQTREQSEESSCILLFSLIKPARLSILIEKATELGVTEFYPLVTENSEIKHLNFERFAEIAVSASQQCGRMSIPKWHAPQALINCLKEWDSTKPLFYCDERRQAQHLRDALNTTSEIPALLIGPEGGFSKVELALLEVQTYAKSVSLGANILRSETAAIAAVAIATLSLPIIQKSQ